MGMDEPVELTNFCMLLKLHASLKVIENFRGWHSQKWM